MRPTCRRVPGARSTDKDRDWTKALLGVAALVLMLTAGLMAFGKPMVDDTGALLGVSAAPTLMLAVMAALVLGGLTWRLDPLGAVWAPLLAVVLVGSAFSAWWLWAVAAVLLAVLVSLVWRSLKAADEAVAHVAWRGMGPGVLMGLSLGVALALAGLVALVAGDWLNGKYPASDLLVAALPYRRRTPRPHRHRSLQRGALPTPDPHLQVPSPYVLFGAGTVVTLLLVALLVGAVFLRTAFKDPPESALPDGIA